MSIEVKKSTMVYPAEATRRQSLWLSRLDMMIRQPYSHTRLLCIYPPNERTSSSTFFDVEILKGALSKALVLYYPIAGRLKINEDNGRYEIDCNDMGIVFVEAETTCTLSDLSDEFKPNHELRKGLIPVCDYSKGLSSIPLFMVQVTRFGCGGVTCGVATHHNVSDAVGDLQFSNCWASIARGVEPRVMPCHDRAAFLAPRDPPQVDFRHLEYEPPLPPIPPKSLSGEIPTTSEDLFRLSKEQVNALKQMAISHGIVASHSPSTFKVIAAHVWRNVCKARGLADDQDVKLYMHTDGRSRLKDPSLPRGYFGNVIFFACCVAKAGDIIRKPLWYTIAKIDEALEKMDNPDYLRSAVDYLESQPDLSTLVRGSHSVASPNLFINSWVRLPMSEVDFGWGGPKSTGLGGIKFEGQSTIISSLTEDKSFYVGIRLFTSHMDAFRRYFYSDSYMRRSHM